MRVESGKRDVQLEGAESRREKTEDATWKGDSSKTALQGRKMRG